MRMMISLTGEEIKKTIPYAVICETRFGSVWNTMRRKRRWSAEFTEKERKAATKLFNLSHKWYLVTGVPEEQVMSLDTLCLWHKLADFCGSL